MFNNDRQPTTEEKEAALAGRRVDRRTSTFQLSLYSIGGYGKGCTNLPLSFESEDLQPLDLLDVFETMIPEVLRKLCCITPEKPKIIHSLTRYVNLQHVFLPS
jgi:hypothetical protein